MTDRSKAETKAGKAPKLQELGDSDLDKVRGGKKANIFIDITSAGVKPKDSPDQVRK